MNTVVAPIGLLLVLAATVAPFFLRSFGWAQTAYPYVFSVGALTVFVARVLGAYHGKDMRLKRLHRLEWWIGIIFMVAAVFLFYPGAQLRDWLAFTLAGAALQVYTSLAIPVRERKVAE